MGMGNGTMGQGNRERDVGTGMRSEMKGQGHGAFHVGSTFPASPP